MAKLKSVLDQSPKENTKQGQSKHGPPQKLEAGSGSMEDLATVDWSYP